MRMIMMTLLQGNHRPVRVEGAGAGLQTVTPDADCRELRRSGDTAPSAECLLRSDAEPQRAKPGAPMLERPCKRLAAASAAASLFALLAAVGCMSRLIGDDAAW